MAGCAAVLFDSRLLSVIEVPPRGTSADHGAGAGRHCVVFPAAGTGCWRVGGESAPVVAGATHVILANAPHVPYLSGEGDGDAPRRDPRQVQEKKGLHESREALLRPEAHVRYAAAPALLARFAAWPDVGEADLDFLFPVARAAVDSQTYLLHVALVTFLRRRQGVGEAEVEPLLLGLLARVTGAAMDAALRVRHAVREETLLERARLADAAMRLLGAEIGGGPPLAHMAATLGASPYHLSRVFRAETGYRLPEYRHHLRLRAALRRVAEPGVPLGRIALDLGYASQSHFTDTFRRTFGLPAAEVRRLLGAQSAGQLRNNLEALLAACPYAEGSFTPAAPSGRSIRRLRPAAAPGAGRRAPSTEGVTRRRSDKGLMPPAPQDRTVDAYIASLTGWQAGVVEQLRQLVRRAAPEASEAIKWAQPVYEVNGPVCYLRAFKHHVNFGFWRGTELPDPLGLIQSGGQKMGHVRLTGPADIQPEAFADLVRAAVQLNITRGDPTRPASG